MKKMRRLEMESDFQGSHNDKVIYGMCCIFINSIFKFHLDNDPFFLWIYPSLHSIKL